MIYFLRGHYQSSDRLKADKRRIREARYFSLDNHGVDRWPNSQSPHAGKRSGGALITTLLGIVGAVIGGFIGQAFGYGRTVDSVGQLSEPGFLCATFFVILLDL